MVRVNRITIVGLGLIGGSLGMAIRRKRLAREVVGWSRRAATLTQALRRGAIDRGSRSLEEAVGEADLVVLAAPVDQIVALGRRAAQSMRGGSLLTDVGSTKRAIVQALERNLPRGIAFVGAHPLAGSERHGIAAAEPTLFNGSLCIVTRTPRTSSRGVGRVTAFWKSVAGRVTVMDPAAHDRLLAQVSHLPHLLAFCLMHTTDHDGLRVAPRSFLEATRVAKSDSDLWDDIFLSNRKALIEAMNQFERQWRSIRRLIVGTNRQALRRWLANAKRQRDLLPDA